MYYTYQNPSRSRPEVKENFTIQFFSQLINYQQSGTEKLKFLEQPITF